MLKFLMLAALFLSSVSSQASIFGDDYLQSVKNALLRINSNDSKVTASITKVTNFINERSISIIDKDILYTDDVEALLNSGDPTLKEAVETLGAQERIDAYDVPKATITINLHMWKAADFSTKETASLATIVAYMFELNRANAEDMHLTELHKQAFDL